MTRKSQLFENATQIAERKIRQARAEQSEEARRMVMEGLRALLSRVRRSAPAIPTGGKLRDQ